MREIKFRYWDKENNEMINADVLAFEEYLPVADHLNQEGIMQYTGMKDVNGVEIYEGDILQPSNNEKKIFTVVWREGESGFKRKYSYVRKYQREEYEGTSYLPIYPNGHKVIGNIHENPELIK